MDHLNFCFKINFDYAHTLQRQGKQSRNEKKKQINACHNQGL